MAITKSNKHKLSLDQDKPNEKGGCTLATPYTLMRSLILDYQISITPLGSCSPLRSKVFPQLNKWVREGNCTGRRSINTPTQKHNHWAQFPFFAQEPDRTLLHSDQLPRGPTLTESTTLVLLSKPTVEGLDPSTWSGTAVRTESGLKFALWTFSVSFRTKGSDGPDHHYS
jgi:hypothetical protein